MFIAADSSSYENGIIYVFINVLMDKKNEAHMDNGITLGCKKIK